MMNNTMTFDEIDFIDNYLRSLNNADELVQKLSPDEFQQYNVLLDEFIKVNSSNSSSKEKGEVLEQLVKCLIDNTHLYDSYRNIHTSTNEIDIFFKLNNAGKHLISKGILHDLPFLLLGECKDYKGTIGVTYVGKFFSLLKTSNINIGVMFSAKGIGGRSPWNAGKGLVKKLYMQRENINNRTAILDFTLDDFERIRSGETFTRIISEKRESLFLDTSVSSFIKKHSAEDKL